MRSGGCPREQAWSCPATALLPAILWSAANSVVGVRRGTLVRTNASCGSLTSIEHRPLNANVKVTFCLEAYQRRWSIILVITIAVLVFPPHLTVRAFPMPSCDFISVPASQGVLALLVLMLGYLGSKTVLAYRR